MITEDHWKRAGDILKHTGVVDCHCDTVLKFNLPGREEEGEYSFGRLNRFAHLDLPRMEKGGVKLQFFAVCVESFGSSSLNKALSYLERYYQNLEEYGSSIAHVNSFEDISAANKEGKIAALLSLEGGAILEGDPLVLRQLHRLGVRSLSLTWNYRNHLADGLFERDSGGGLTRAGREVIKTMDELGMVLDLAHIAPRGYHEAIELVNSPVLVSHANAFAICPHYRNLTDEQLSILSSQNGIVGLSFYPPFITHGANEAGLEQLLEHFVYIADLIGVECLGIGSDFDGIKRTVDEIYDASCYLHLAAGLLQKGFLPGEVEAILSGNVRRLLSRVIP